MFGMTDELVELRGDLKTALRLLKEVSSHLDGAKTGAWGLAVYQLLTKYETPTSPKRWQEITPGHHVLIQENEVIALISEGFGDSWGWWVKGRTDNNDCLRGDAQTVKIKIESMLL